MEVLKDECSMALTNYLADSLHNTMHLMERFSKGTLYGAFHRNEKTTKAMFAFNDEFLEVEIEVIGSQVYLTRMASSRDLTNLREMAEERLSNYVNKRIYNEKVWNEREEKYSPRRTPGKLYLRRVLNPSQEIHEKNMSLAAEHSFNLNFAKRLTAYNLLIWLKI